MPLIKNAHIQYDSGPIEFVDKQDGIVDNDYRELSADINSYDPRVYAVDQIIRSSDKGVHFIYIICWYSDVPVEDLARRAKIYPTTLLRTTSTRYRRTMEHNSSLDLLSATRTKKLDTEIENIWLDDNSVND